MAVDRPNTPAPTMRISFGELSVGAIFCCRVGTKIVMSVATLL